MYPLFFLTFFAYHKLVCIISYHSWLGVLNMFWTSSASISNFILFMPFLLASRLGF